HRRQRAGTLQDCFGWRRTRASGYGRRPQSGLVAGWDDHRVCRTGQQRKRPLKGRGTRWIIHRSSADSPFPLGGTAPVYAGRQKSRLRTRGVWFARFLASDLATKKTRQLTHFNNPSVMRAFDVTADGKQIVFDRLRDNSDIVMIELPQAK